MNEEEMKGLKEGITAEDHQLKVAAWKVEKKKSNFKNTKCTKVELRKLGFEGFRWPVRQKNKATKIQKRFSAG